MLVAVLVLVTVVKEAWLLGNELPQELKRADSAVALLALTTPPLVIKPSEDVASRGLTQVRFRAGAAFWGSGTTLKERQSIDQ